MFTTEKPDGNISVVTNSNPSILMKTLSSGSSSFENQPGAPRSQPVSHSLPSSQPVRHSLHPSQPVKPASSTNLQFKPAQRVLVFEPTKQNNDAANSQPGNADVTANNPGQVKEEGSQKKLYIYRLTFPSSIPIKQFGGLLSRHQAFVSEVHTSFEKFGLLWPLFHKSINYENA